MTKRKKIIIALCIIIPLFIILGYCIYVAIDLMSGLYVEIPVMENIEKDIQAFLDEHDFSYTRNYEEDEDTQTAEYVITEGETSANLVVSYGDGCQLEFTITDRAKDFDQNIYTTLDLMNLLSGRGKYFSVESMTKDEYKYSQTNEVTVYRHDLNIRDEFTPEYYFEVTLKDDGYSIYILEDASEEYFY